ncbi:metallophosphoesterase [Dactylosporangium sp. AC04546]|uniref:metallophosphoesterase family protein n=1 Tax=Dactylosporangium sp. AC04546 TaxID=2862460 RepID=UPI001EDC9F24|nr:metallophosphoesterase [Dactylosporangium sp. AC04546]WVK89449.1 metallophosphoesterase [Dactylosporangium sp. AC04546]
MPDDMPAAPGELTAQPGEPLLPLPDEGDVPTVGRRPTGLDPDQMGFTPRRAVPWLSPVLLSGTAVRVVLADLFGAYLDKRELQDALPSRILRESAGFSGDADGGDDWPDGGELWVDYIADTGDGFNATYSVAYLAAQESLTVDEQQLPRGEVLVLGGDQVYPTASGQQYEDRFKGPFRAALPEKPPNPPRMYAVPGNHDWYDGLTAFLRLFVRGNEGAVGGWRTRQSRSYFAIQLPNRWWLLGTDVQAGAYIDDPQLRYFNRAAALMGPGDKVIICPPAPSWVESEDDRKAYDSLDYFVRTVIAPTGADVRLMISGDLHHYARYERPGRQLITCGGGGAYLYPTHELPEAIEVPPRRSLVRNASPTQEFALAATYPAKAQSRGLSLGVFWRLPWRNPMFLGLLGLLQTLTMLAFVNAADRVVSGVEQRLVTVPAVLMTVIDVLGTCLLAMPHTAGQRRPRHWILGLLHGAAFVGLATLGTWAWLSLPFVEQSWPLPLLLAIVLYFPLSAVASGELFALYLLIASKFDVNLNELFAGQGITGYKGFLRLHFRADGGLTIYPLGVKRTGRRWHASTATRPDASWFEPRRPLEVHLMEKPISID